jgi:hypothetical protein
MHHKHSFGQRMAGRMKGLLNHKLTRKTQADWVDRSGGHFAGHKQSDN